MKAPKQHKRLPLRDWLGSCCCCVGAEQRHWPENPGTRPRERQEEATERSARKSSTEGRLEEQTRPLGGLGEDGAIIHVSKTLEL